MDRFLAPHSPEAKAHEHLTENPSNWDLDAHLDEQLVALFASYNAFVRYLTGGDLYILPRDRSELEGVLRRYSVDQIHNTIARSRATVAPGGYTRMCHAAEASIRTVLNSNSDHVAHLIDLHRAADRVPGEQTSASTVKIK